MIKATPKKLLAALGLLASFVAADVHAAAVQVDPALPLMKRPRRGRQFHQHRL